MNGISTPKHLGSLALQLKQKLEQDRAQIAAMTSNELEKLACDLRTKYENAVSTTAADIARGQEELRQHVTAQTQLSNQAIQQALKRLHVSWLMPSLVALCLLAAISLGTWGLTQYLSYRIQAQLERQEILETALSEQRKTLEFLAQQTWGLQLMENKEGRWLILPRGWTMKTGWVLDGKEVVHLQRR